MRKRKKRRMEFSKKLAVWAAIVGPCCIALSFWLASQGLDPNADVAIAVFVACDAYIGVYAGKSLGEKVSRNRHGLDAQGNPINNMTTNNEEAAG